MPDPSISFIIPAYKCAHTIMDSIESILDGNFFENDEIIIVNDASPDALEEVLEKETKDFRRLNIIHHEKNMGGAAARNTAVRNAVNELIFCLDSDNVLENGSVQVLRKFLIEEQLDAASFQTLKYFEETKKNIALEWVFNPGEILLSDVLSGGVTPVSSGNYLYTKKSWKKAGGYPEFAGALDTWGFGVRQLATGSRMGVLGETYYYHRLFKNSYWRRDYSPRRYSKIALRILELFRHLVDEKDWLRISDLSERDSWFDQMKSKPIRIVGFPSGRQGKIKRKSRLSRVLKKVLVKLSADGKKQC